MKERDRVLELVKKGVITTDEALVLLENMAIAKDESIIEQEASEVKRHHLNKQAEESDEVIKGENEEQAKLEQLLDDLATELNQTSSKLDVVNAEIEDVTSEINMLEEQIMIINTLEELDELAPEKREERVHYETKLGELKKQRVAMEEEVLELEARLKEVKTSKRELNEEEDMRFQLPDDWEQTLTDLGDKMEKAGEKFGKKMNQAGNQFSKLMKETMKTVTNTVNDHVDWKDVNIKVPGMAISSFDHEFYYPACAASIIDVKVANGVIEFRTWDSEDIKVVSHIKLYGKMEADTPFEAFLERSEIEVDEERISFQIPNKRIKAELIFYLPTRSYDHVSAKILNGDINVFDLEAKDTYLKSTNGDLMIDGFTATMLEAEGVNGDVTVKNASVLDFIGTSVNGDFILKAALQNISVGNVNGDIRVTTVDESLKNLDAKVVNGDIKVALPQEQGIEGLAKTSLGAIKNRLSEYEVIREKTEKTNRMLQFRRYHPEDTVYIKLSTTTGNVLLKDAD
ncbi:daptomycin-sensing surface protein LiaX [Vagococcus lutrae]|uniref:daptomycin-sensing surface protein LiaX n=1 Tax=Vagococcus lutrae TaxID=81947 RepID=UPI00288F472C|nr:daptomycin-sensing surface protein LiaX [Vagococcus lutrae]MDT2808103.1 daptomycin-sensing surface protein LiaX [Vagococcus lutrae]